MTEHPSVWKRLWSYFDWLDSIDVLLYGGLGAAVLGYVVYSIGNALHEAGSRSALVVLVAIVAASVACLIRDLRKRHLSGPSKLLAVAWAACVALVLVVELIGLSE